MEFDVVIRIVGDHVITGPYCIEQLAPSHGIPIMTQEESEIVSIVAYRRGKPPKACIVRIQSIDTDTRTVYVHKLSVTGMMLYDKHRQLVTMYDEFHATFVSKKFASSHRLKHNCLSVMIFLHHVRSNIPGNVIDLMSLYECFMDLRKTVCKKSKIAGKKISVSKFKSYLDKLHALQCIFVFEYTHVTDITIVYVIC